MKTLSIIGAGGHGGTVADVAARSGHWSRVEFYDDRVAKGSDAFGVPVRGTVESLFARLAGDPADASDVFVAVGDNARRLALVQRAVAVKVPIATLIHPSAVIGSRVVLGAGSVVMAGAVINIDTQIGLACIVNTRASVDHQCVLGDGVHVCPGVSLAGNVRIGDLAWIGIGACVIQGRSIGARATVGAGSVVIRDIEEGVTVVGNPAKVSSTRVTIK